MISQYNQEHLETFKAVRDILVHMPNQERDALLRASGPYLDFRKEVASFQEQTFSHVCTLKCFQDNTSACCAREGIAAFFGDVVLNCLLGAPGEVDALIQALVLSIEGPQCVYLTENGCLWTLKPVVCEMFLCDHAIKTVLDPNEALKSAWEDLRERERRFTWPDRPVLFDELEAVFLEKGCDSPLMYLHKSPGLLRLKSRWKNQDTEIFKAD